MTFWQTVLRFSDEADVALGIWVPPRRVSRLLIYLHYHIEEIVLIKFIRHNLKFDRIGDDN